MRKRMLMRTLVVLGGLAAGRAVAEHADLVVGAGEEVTISTNSFYNSITVNGSLTIDSAAVVQIVDASGGGKLYVASGDGATGTLTVRDGAKLFASDGNSASHFWIGHAGGTGTLNVDGGILWCYNLCLGNDVAQSRACLTLSNGADVYAHNAVVSGGYHASGAPSPMDVTLQSDAVLRAWTFNLGGDIEQYIHFRGGRVSAQSMYIPYHGNLVCDGTADYPIQLTFPSSRKSDGTYYYTYFLTTGGNGGMFVFTGPCDFVKMGTGGSDQDLITYASSKYLKMEYTGRTWVKEGGFALRGADLLPKGSDLVLERGTSVNWGGNWQELKSVTGKGKIYAQGTSDRLTLNVDEDQTARLSCAIDNTIALVKTGKGTLEVLEDLLGNVTVSDGRLKVLNRAEFGYDLYRIKIDSAYSPKYDAVHLGELYLYDGAVEVSTNYLTTSQPNLFDKTYDNSHKWWISANYGTDTETSFNNRYATIEFEQPRKITAYSWVTAGDSPSSWETGRDPGSWRLMGSMSGGSTLQTLSTVGHREYLLVDRWAETVHFPVTFPQPVASNLTVEAKGTLELADGVVLSCRAMSVSGGDIVYGAGAKLVTASDGDSFLSYPAMAGGAFEKAGAGTATVRGELAGLSTLAVSAGTLAIDNGYAVTNRYYRFVIASNRWMVVNAPTEPTQDIQRTIQIGELAIYDRKGVRINLGATGTQQNLCDGDTLTSCYYIKLPTPYDFDLTLPETPESCEAVGYLFAIETKWGGVPDKTPRAWTVYTRANESDPWSLLDEQTNTPYTQINTSKPWQAWNNGAPWMFGVKAGGSRPAFDAETEISVAAGATLDVSGTGAATVIGRLSVDCAGAGAIRGGAFAETGVLSVTNFTPGAALPLTFAGTVAPQSLAGWEVYLDGVRTQAWSLSYDGTALRLLPQGTLFLVR